MTSNRLREALEDYRGRTETHLICQGLSRSTGISLETRQSLASRPGYNTRLSTVEKLSKALDGAPAALLEWTRRKGRSVEIDKGDSRIARAPRGR